MPPKRFSDMYYMPGEKYGSIIFLPAEKADSKTQGEYDAIRNGYRMLTELVTRHTLPKDMPSIGRVIFNDPATIVFWNDGTKTVVKCRMDDEFEPEYGLAMAIAKKYLGSTSKLKKLVAEFNHSDEE